MLSSVCRWFSMLTVVAIALTYAACSNPTGPSAIAGAWNAGCSGASSACTGLVLTESGSALTGSAQTYTGSYGVTGTYVRPHITLVLTPVATSAATIRYDGSAEGVTLALRTVGPNPETVVYVRGTVNFPEGGTAIAR